FPHHTCEIAQSEHFTGKVPFSRFWVHVGMVHQDGEKMSKSLGNLTLVSNLLKNYNADTIRVTLLNHHYRFPWECFPADLEFSSHLVALFQQVRALVGTQTSGQDHVLHDQFEAAMDNDLNTPQAFALLQASAENVIAHRDLNTGAEVLRLIGILGLTV
ncbi:MAG: class I tRNA ligase family protein, partial [Ktedonobacteraceae bacterium]